MGFLYLFQYSAPAPTNTFAALTVTPSGLVTVWIYTGNNTWQQE